MVAGINEYIEGYGILRCAHDTVCTRERFPFALQFAIGIQNTQLSFSPGSQFLEPIYRGVLKVIVIIYLGVHHAFLNATVSQSP